MLSTCVNLLQWWRYSALYFSHVPHTYSTSQLLASHVYLPRHRPSRRAQIVVYTHGLEISLLWSSELVSKCFNAAGNLKYAPHRYPTHIRSPNYCHRMCTCQGIDTETIAQIDVYTLGLENWLGVTLSTCAKLLQWCWYFGLCSTQVLHTYSVSQLLPSHLYFPKNRHRQSAQIDVYTHGVDISLLLCCHRVPKCLNDAGILDSAVHSYPTHIRSPNYCHRMCIGQGIGSEQSLKLSFIHTVSTFHFCNSVEVCSSASMMDVVVYYCHTGRARHARTVGMPKSWIVTCWYVPALELQHSIYVPKPWSSRWCMYTEMLNVNGSYIREVYIYPKLQLQRGKHVPKTGIMSLNMYMQNLNLCTVYAYWILEF